jgi:outer membrane protein assembly factor BamB
MLKRTLPLAALLALAAAVAAIADDWPQWQGPRRDNISTEIGLLKQWPVGGPRLLWTFTGAGVGYSGPAIVGDRLYTMGSKGDQGCVIALDVATGKEVWRTSFGPLFKVDHGGGPRCTPTVDGDRVYALGAQGILLCVEAASGKEVWRKTLTDDLAGKTPHWGYAESPLVDGDHLICTPGGEAGTLAALDKKTGDVVWRSEGLRDSAAYSSIVISEVGGVRQYVQMTPNGVVGVAVRDGKLLWRQNVGANRIATIATPVIKDNCVYVTSDYNAGCALVELMADGGQVRSNVVYKNGNMQNHHGGVVLIDGCLYGWSGNSNARGHWVCQDFMSGETVWTSEKFRQAGSVTYAGDRLYCYGQNDGTIVLAEVSRAGGWKERGRFTIPQHTNLPRNQGHVWTRPVVANGKLYLRDLDLIFCYDVKDSSRP